MSGILHVCMANRARSALAELATRDGLAARGIGDAVPVASAGTWTRGGEPMWPPAAALAAERGWDASGFASRQVTVDAVRRADLVLAATRALRDEVIALAPFALRRCFTWRELAWLLDGAAPGEVPGATPIERTAGVAAVAGARRGHLVAPPGSSLDVADPVNRPISDLGRVAEVISVSIGVLLDVIAGQRPG